MRALLLPETATEGAENVGERLRASVAQTTVAVEGHTGTFAISVGVAVWAPGEPLERLLARADQALHAAKNDGRNRVCLAPAANHKAA